MTPTSNGSPSVLRSVGAVAAGLLAIIVLSIGTDAILRLVGVFPSDGTAMGQTCYALATGHRLVWSIAGCALAARLAPTRPMLHAMVLGLIGVVLSAAGVAVAWGKGPEFGPRWYPIALVLIALPCAWVGGMLASDRPGQRAA